ncbi:MAG: hypothetical protein OEW15_17555 [Nitrospirota bacterium]|nr:hypothetical protein [Nitrospirota bacterium]
MSYSLEQKCGECANQGKCADGVIIKTAVQGMIHSLDFQRGHRGGGVIKHECSPGTGDYGFVPKNQPAENTEVAHP